MELHFPKFSFGKTAGCFVRDKATIDSALSYAVVVDTAAVVFDFDVDVITAVIGTESDTADIGFVSFAAGKVEFHLLAGGFRGVTNGARQPRIQGANGHHARSGDFGLQMVSEFGEFVDIAFDAPDEAAHLGEDFVYVGGNLGHGARENVNVVVTIHFEFAEFRPEGSVARGGVG